MLLNEHILFVVLVLLAVITRLGGGGDTQRFLEADISACRKMQEKKKKKRKKQLPYTAITILSSTVLGNYCFCYRKVKHLCTLSCLIIVSDFI